MTVVLASNWAPLTAVPQRIGPFKDSSGNLWIIGQSGNVKGHFKSTDNGASWSSFTSSGQPSSGGWDSVIDAAGNNIYSICVTSVQISIFKLVLSTETWSEVYSSGTRPAVPSNSNGPQLELEGTAGR